MRGTIRMALALLLAPLTSAAPGLSPTAAHAADCAATGARFDAARSTGDSRLAISIYGELSQPSTGCTEQVTYCAGNAIALDLLGEAYAAQDNGNDLAEVATLLERASDFGAPWQLLVAQADQQFARGQTRKDAAAFEEAAGLYQEAVNQLNEAPVCGDLNESLSDVEIAPIYRRMTESLMLAPEFKVVRTRSGQCGGVFLASIRGFTPRFRPIPIGFVFAEDNFTESGSAAAEVLLSCIIDTGGIVLSGHTDPIGSDEFNLQLSRDRLERVAGYLRQHGYSGEITLLPKGESEPFEPDDPLAYSEEELNQLNRRVVLRDSRK